MWTSRLLLALALAACDDDGGPALPPGETPCGEGPLTFALGTEDPFQPSPDAHFQVVAGLQGGYHFDLSVRTQGALDPDHTDIELVLWQGQEARARHLTADWLLSIDRSGPWCDYPRARLVLVDEAGGLMPRERLAEVVAGPLTLQVKLTSPLGGGEATLPITLALSPGI